MEYEATRTPRGLPACLEGGLRLRRSSLNVLNSRASIRPSPRGRPRGARGARASTRLIPQHRVGRHHRGTWPAFFQSHDLCASISTNWTAWSDSVSLTNPPSFASSQCSLQEDQRAPRKQSQATSSPLRACLKPSKAPARCWLCSPFFSWLKR